MAKKPEPKPKDIEQEQLTDDITEQDEQEQTETGALDDATKPAQTEESQETPDSIEDSVDIATAHENTDAPQAIKMLKEFRISYPFRPDASTMLTLKAGQEITDTHVIKHLLNSDAPFIVIK